MKTETYQCQGCAAEVTRPVARGQRPKWCPDCRAKSAQKHRLARCEQCHGEYFGIGLRFCSVACANFTKVTRAAKVKPKKIPVDRRSKMRAGYEDGDWDLLLAGIRDHVEIVDGCWKWTRKLNDGYPVVTLGGKHLQVHRLSLAARMRAHLGSQAAHHACANSWCVNPEHLQPVTHRENVAEMLARQSYLARIRDLEAALATLDPCHPLLHLVAVA